MRLRPSPQSCLRAAALALAFVSPSAFAIPSAYPKLQNRQIRVGVLGNSYLTRANESLSDSGTGNLGLLVGVRGVGSQKNFHFGVEGESLYGLRHANYRYLDVGEVYAGIENKEEASRASVYIGRKRYEWNQLDSYWSLGLYQPRFRWDYLSERENGLFGLFPGVQTETFQLTAFYSPIFIPEQGAPFDISGGTCRSSSPWFSCPGSSIQVFNQSTDVRFSLDVPPIRSLIAHPGYGATMRFGRAQGLFSRFSYTHKPMNQLLLSFEGRLALATSTVPAIIRPRVLYHDLYGADLGWQNERHGITLSGMLERPIRDYTPPTWNTQESSQANIVGITTRTSPIQSLPHTKFEFSFLHRDGGVDPDRGPFVSPGADYFEPRYAFQNAFSFGLASPIAEAWSKRFLFSSKFIVDTVNTGNLLVTDLFYSPVEPVLLNAGADILGSNSTSPVDFLSRYQRNDRVRMGVSYVF